MRAPIRVRDLHHAYDRAPVLAVPDLDLEPGRHHLQGPNGAGKTTLLKILAGLIRPTEGEVEVAGHRLPDEARRARAASGFAGHEASLHAELPARQALAVHARLHGASLEAVDASLDAWRLSPVATERVSSLSHGQRRRLDLARALLHDPDVVLLDEPTSGLDRAAVEILEERLAEATPELVLLAAPEPPALDVDEHVRLDDGHLVEATP